MAFTEITLAKYASDLVVAHADFHFSNDEANITPAGVIPFGTVVCRPKDSAPTVAWTAIDAAADVVATNEFGIVFGDHYAFKYDFTPKAIVAGKFNAILVVRDAGFKEYYIKAVHKTVLGDAPYALLIQLLANQGLVVLKDVSDYVVA
jgi:hypothetical protein